MNVLNIPATADLPEIIMDKEASDFRIHGRSIPHDAVAFYQPVKYWVREYCENPNPLTTLHCHLEYFNSASQKNLLELFKNFRSLSTKGFNFVLKWYYHEDDEASFQIGEIFQDLLDIRMDFVRLPEAP